MTSNQSVELIAMHHGIIQFLVRKRRFNKEKKSLFSDQFKHKKPMAVKYLLIFMILAAYFQGKSYQKFISKVDSSYLYSVN